MRRLLGIAVLLVCVVSAGAARAAWVEPDLDDQLSSASPGQTFHVYVVMRDRVNLSALNAEMDAAHLTRAQRHVRVIHELQDTAASAQGSLMTSLVAAGSAVRHYRPFWIADAVAVEAEAAFINTLRNRSDVRSIYLDRPLELIEPVAEGAPRSIADVAASVLPNISALRAPEMWAMGYDGTGTLACDQDTGEDGTHPAFADRWRGLEPGVDPSEAWFDPVGGETFPTDSGSHGTHTMGTILGEADGRVIGMAPGAHWIGAKTIDVPGGNIYSDAVAAFEWMADPDGNPGTIDDVPDAVNNSWGIPNPTCQDDFWDAIDAAEAAGVVVVFAAGNEGPAARTLRSPGNRIASDVNTLAVGALKQDATTITSFSSRGPSRCDNQTIKPEVAAVGDNVLSSFPGDQYGTLSGTSMATPAVTGAALLLRSAFPEATPDQVKTALYLTAVDLGAAGEDNVYGNGRVDVVEAYWWLLEELLDSDGRVSVDESIYTCHDTVTVTVSDADLSSSATVTIKSDTEPAGETMVLPPWTITGVFKGSIDTASGAPASDGVLQLSDGDTITVTYTDAFDGSGTNVVKTVTADSDCVAPTFAGLTDLNATDNEVDLTWDAATGDTDVTYYVYRSDASGDEDFDAAPYDTTDASPYTDPWAPNGAEWFYVVRAADALGNTDTNTVELSGTPDGQDRLFFDNFDMEPRPWEIVDGGAAGSWNTENGGARTSAWWMDNFIIADKSTAGDLQRMDEQLITPPIDCSHHEDIRLRFKHQYEHGLLDHAIVSWSYDEVNWNNVANWYRNEEGLEEFSIPEATLYPQVFFRFYYANAMLDGEYWGIDNVEVLGTPSTGDPTTTTTSTTTTTTTTIPGDDDTDDDTTDDDTADDDTGDDDTTDDDTADDDTADDDTLDDDTLDDDDDFGADDDAAAGGGGDDDDNGGCCG